MIILCTFTKYKVKLGTCYVFFKGIVVHKKAEVRGVMPFILIMSADIALSSVSPLVVMFLPNFLG